MCSSPLTVAAECTRAANKMPETNSSSDYTLDLAGHIHTDAQSEVGNASPLPDEEEC